MRGEPAVLLAVHAAADQVVSSGTEDAGTGKHTDDSTWTGSYQFFRLFLFFNHSGWRRSYRSGNWCDGREADLLGASGAR